MYTHPPVLSGYYQQPLVPIPPPVSGNSCCGTTSGNSRIPQKGIRITGLITIALSIATVSLYLIVARLVP